MKKLQKNLMMELLALAGLFIFGGCVKTETPEGPETEDPKDGFVRLVSSVEVTRTEGDDTHSMAYDFKYDESDRLTDIIVFYDGNEQGHAKFIFMDDKIRMIDLYDDDYSMEWRFNTRGLVNTQITYYGEDEYETEYYYGKDGLLNSRVETREQSGYRHEQTYDRAEGNVVMYTYSSSDSEEESSDYYTYTDYVDKSNLDVMAIIGNELLSGYPCKLTEMDKSVFKSLGNTNLPKTFINPRYDGDNWSFTYEFDAEGYLTLINTFNDEDLNFSMTVKY